MSRTGRDGRKRLTPGTVLGVIAVVLAASGVAQGGIPAADGTITACMGRANRLHLIDKEAGETCADSQTEIALNQPAEGALTAATLGPTSWEHGVRMTVPDGNFGTATVDCPVGTRLLSGGGLITTSPFPHEDVFVVRDVPDFTGDSWVFEVRNISGADIGIRAEALCLE